MGIFRSSRAEATTPVPGARKPRATPGTASTPAAAGVVPQNARYTRMEDEKDDWDRNATVGERLWALVTKRLIVEFFGMFFIALVSSQCAAFTTSLTMAALTFTAASASGAHFSPAISLAYVCLGALQPMPALAYYLFQTLGALFGLLTASALFEPEAALAASKLPPLGTPAAIALVAPTLIYTLVHLSVLSEGKRTQFFGLAVGFALYAGLVAHGEASGSACLLNPALALANWLGSFLVLGGGSSPLVMPGLTPSTNPIINQLLFLALTGTVAAVASKLFEACNAAGSTAATLLTELVGTYLSCLLVVATADEGRELSAQAVGLGIGALSYFGGEVSEAHYNPIVSLAHALTGSLPRDELPAYLGAQLAGSLAASYTAGFLVHEVLPTQTLAADEMLSTVGLNTMLFGLLVAFVHLSVLGAQGGKHKSEANGFYGYAVGFAYVAGIWIFGGKNGASAANPFLAISIHLAGASPLELFTGGAESREVGRLILLSVLGSLLAAAAFAAVRLGADARPAPGTQRDSSTAATKRSRAGRAGFLAAEAVGAALLTMGLLASQGYGGQMAEGFGVAGTSSGTAAGMDMGALYIALTSSLAYISGAALNPAISLAFVLQGKRELRLRGLEASDCLLAMGVQLASAIVATLVYGAMLPTGQSLPPSALMRWHRPTEPGGRCWDPSTSAPIAGTCTFPGTFENFHDHNTGVSVVEEAIGVLLFSFALILVHLSTVGDQPQAGFSGLAVGFALLAGVLAYGDLSTGLFNPALPIGLYVGKVALGAPLLFGEIVCVGALVMVPFVAAPLAVVANSFNNNPDKPAALITEGIGSFVIVLCLLKAPGSVGLMYCAIVYFGAHVSLAHFNPAITLAHYFLGRCSFGVLRLYAAAQTIGALIAGCLALEEGDTLPAADPDASPLDIALAEFLIAFAIIFVHLSVLNPQAGVGSLGLGGHVKQANTAVTTSRASNDYFGLSVGFTFLAGFTAVGPISGGFFNPAAGLGLYVARAIAGHSHSLALGQTLYYVTAPCLAALLAHAVYDARFEQPADDDESNSRLTLSA